ncbi:uncharacterized protein LOC132042152 [Lycium ferocissimum]|uniref:uncharacterized protein LOC132042152 n=1 Tax=Lycium ferocissimum TaxID=112874 RepID=UPI002814EC70|nr:uncharacterized protein LOC132042152 [Lycium ferocissimum]
MSFPWKKLKKTSISQLVKDHFRSRTPLMVETGFPTSLVDLFVKNRRRFIKTSKKKRPSSVVAKPHFNSPSQSLPLSSHMAPPLPASYKIQGSQLKGCQEKGERIDLDEAVDKNMVLIALLKIFLVVLLVLGTKNLALGITMSALLLFIFEYSGERVYRLFMPCALVGARMVELEEEGCVFKAPLQQDELGSCDFANQVQEIHIKEKTDESSSGSKLKCEGMDSKGDVMEKKTELRSELLGSKREKSHKSGMKSKMKRFLAKKFRRKVNKESETQMIPIRETDNIIQENDKLEDFNDCPMSSEKVPEATIVNVDSFGGREHNISFTLLLLVVLVGLTGGRTFALVFTLTWCMMSKQVLLKIVVKILQLIPSKM